MDWWKWKTARLGYLTVISNRCRTREASNAPKLTSRLRVVLRATWLETNLGMSR